MESNKNQSRSLFKKQTLFQKLKSLKKNEKLFFLSIVLVIAGALFSIPMLSKFHVKSDLLLDFEGSALYAENLFAASKAAIQGRISENKYAAFRFTDKQKKLLENFYNEKKAVSLTFEIKFNSISYKDLLLDSENEKPFSFGFLYQNDFDEKGNFIGKAKNRILGSADSRLFVSAKPSKKDSSAILSLALKKNLENAELPWGFIVFSKQKAHIMYAKFEEARVGFDLTGKTPFYGLAPTGGRINDFFTADFSGCQDLFSLTNSKNTIMPKILLQVEDNSDYDEEKAASDSQRTDFQDLNSSQSKENMAESQENQTFSEKNRNKKLFLNAGGEILTIYKNPGSREYTLQTQLLTNPFAVFFAKPEETKITKLLMEKNSNLLIAQDKTSPLKPLTTDLGLIPPSRKTNLWRNPDYELYRWESFPKVLLFDTKDYKVQGDFFTRLAFFAEKAGYRGRILTDQEIGDMHGYNAHDYRDETLAAFFTKAKEKPGVLNQHEELLKEILIENRIIIPAEDGSYKAGEGAIISISQSSADYLRNSLCAHEAWHGIYFTDEDFRNTTAAIYYTIDPNAVDFLIGYWKSQPSLNYDSQDDYLIKNEFMAYIMQQGVSASRAYFKRIANFASVQKAIPDSALYVIQTDARAFEDAAIAFDSYASDRWGLSNGRVSLITK